MSATASGSPLPLGADAKGPRGDGCAGDGYRDAGPVVDGHKAQISPRDNGRNRHFRVPVGVNIGLLTAVMTGLQIVLSSYCIRLYPTVCDLQV